ncbi:DUF6256 family protein [Streptomyces sp. KR80]|uniref:DUF6256 family protein n=1 Tax=Streptomyces sp. KR80 TaxID=3457426 RepID=UPI003FD5C3DA
MLPVSLNIAIMSAGYLLIMGYLALGLRILRRQPTRAELERARRQLRGQRVGGLTPATARRGWPTLIRRVVGTAVGGYVLLMAVVIGYYHGVARLGGRFLTSAFTGCAQLLGIALPLYFIASWVAVRRRR